MKKHIALLLAICMLFAVCGVAMGADEGSVGANTNFAQNTNAASTDVYLKIGDDAANNLSATVPLSVTLAVKADGIIVAPAASSYKITNTSAFPIKVANVKTVAETGYNFVTVHALASNELLLTLKAGSGSAVNLDTWNSATGASVTGNVWNAAGNGTIGLELAGSVKNLSVDITGATGVKAFTITYTIAAGSHT